MRASSIFRVGWGEMLHFQHMKKYIFGAVTALFVGFLFMPLFAFAAYDWAETQPAGDIDRLWYAADGDSDFSNLFVGAGYNQRLYTSTNGGDAWTETQPAGNIDTTTETVASDADGSNLIAGVTARLYTSSDGGANWTERQPGGDVNLTWQSVDSDSDGSNLIAGVYAGRLYTSSDSGANWTERQPAGAVNIQWLSVRSDADGSNLFVGARNGRIYTSSDSGANWTERRPAGDVNGYWYGLASDADGSTLVAANSGGRIYTSSDSGANWTERQPAGAVNKDWEVVTSDATGTYLLAGIYDGALYSSDDGGVTWSVEEPVVGNMYWASLAVSDDGSKAIAGVDGGRLYVGSPIDATAPTTDIFSPADEEIDVEVAVNLEITFDEDVATSTGDIVIYKASDDSIAETIDVTSALVTALSATEFSINPSADLEEGVAYYIQIDTGAFVDLADNDFAGIADETTWNFETVPAPVVEEEDSGAPSSHRRSSSPSNTTNEASSALTLPTDVTTETPMVFTLSIAADLSPEVEAKVVEIQTKLIDLLTQLIAELKKQGLL